MNISYETSRYQKWFLNYINHDGGQNIADMSENIGILQLSIQGKDDNIMQQSIRLMGYTFTEN